jgi:quinolinate synthase
MEIKEKILKLKAEKDAVILAHYYVPGDVQEVADFVGDSYYLSKVAAEAKESVIVFCGVNFMGESAKMLNPDKKVIMPDLKADCPMAHMATVEGIEAARRKHEDLAVVCYINSTAEIKAHSDVCVTSSNALSVVSALPQKNIYFIPDQNLGRYISRLVPEKNFIFNDGYCHVHTSIKKDDLLEKKAELPKAKVASHPECREEILELSDFVGSTSDIIKYVEKTDAEDFLICTETGIFHALEKVGKGKRFHAVSGSQICPDMKLNTLEKLLHALETLDNELHMDESLMKKGLQPLELMLKLAGRKKNEGV